MSLLFYLMAFAGGLVLNVMPCVLPVLTMKVFHLMEQGESSARARRDHGLAYLGGVLATFAALAAALIAVQAAGGLVGWGMQFGDPRFVAAMTLLIFVFALNALGVFEFTVSIRTGDTGGMWGSFVNGVVASIMSTPCSGPFLGAAAGFALGGAAPIETVAIFLCIGAGLAAPFVVFSLVPAAGRLLPRPGMWMDTFKQLMGFSLMATSAWLFTVLMKQTSEDAAARFVFFLVAVAVGAWLIGRFGAAIHSERQRLLVRALTLGALVVGGAWGLRLESRAPATPARAELQGPVVLGDHIAWRAFDPGLVTDALGRGRPVFVDFTADWCMNCKANERLFIETPAVRSALTRTGIVPVKADLTVDDDVIRSWLEPFPYSGLPVYVIYMPDQTYDLLPQVITTELLVERLDAAGARFPR